MRRRLLGHQLKLELKSWLPSIQPRLPRPIALRRQIALPRILRHIRPYPLRNIADAKRFICLNLFLYCPAFLHLFLMLLISTRFINVGQLLIGLHDLRVSICQLQHLYICLHVFALRNDRIPARKTPFFKWLIINFGIVRILRRAHLLPRLRIFNTFCITWRVRAHYIVFHEWLLNCWHLLRLLINNLQLRLINLQPPEPPHMPPSARGNLLGLLLLILRLSMQMIGRSSLLFWLLPHRHTLRFRHTRTSGRIPAHNLILLILNRQLLIPGFLFKILLLYKLILLIQNLFHL